MDLDGTFRKTMPELRNATYKRCMGGGAELDGSRSATYCTSTFDIPDGAIARQLGI